MTEKFDDNVSKTETSRGYLNKPILRQLLVCSSVWISYLASGLIVGSPSVNASHQWSRSNSTDPFRYTVTSWWNSSLGAASLPWVIVLPILMNYIGRKLTFIIIWLGIFICFVISYFTSNEIRALCNDIILAVIVTCGQTVSPTILAEYSSIRYRIFFLSFKSATSYLGIWISRAYGTSFYWNNIGVLSFCFCIYFILIVLWPESPYWSASKGRFVECIVSHRWLKGNDADSEREMEDIVRSYKDCLKNTKSENKEPANILKDSFRKIKSPEFYKPGLIILLLIIHYECSGRFFVSVYALDVLKKITDSEFTAYKIMFIFDGFLVFSTYVGSALSIFLRRRTIYLNFSAISFLFLLILSFYLHLVHLNLLREHCYLALLFIAIHLVSFNCGLVALCSSFIAELMPVAHKSLFLIFFGLFINFVYAISLILTPLLVIYLGFNLTLPLCGMVSLICTILLYIFLPETKNKTLQEIENNFKNDEYSNHCRRYFDKCLTI